MATTDNAAPLYSLWSIQDTLLQNYRTMFLTAESLILGMSSSVASFAKVPALLLVFVGLVLLIVWVRVTRSRARDVSFAQELVKWQERGLNVEQPLITFKTYQAEWNKSGSYVVDFSNGLKAEFKQDGVWPPRDCKAYEVWRWNARLQMEVVLPITYLICWVVVITYVLARAE